MTSTTDHLRGAARLLALLTYTFALVALLAAARATRPIARRWSLRANEAIVRTWARGAARIAGIRLRVTGPAPAPPFFLAVNHLSYVDVLAFMSEAPALFLAKSEVARWPAVGAIARVLGTVFVDRSRMRDLPRVVGELERALRGGEGVLVFGEGTTTPGTELAPFKSSVFEAAVRADVPVHAATVTYRTPPGAPPAETAVCWWGDMTFVDHLYPLLCLPGFEADVRFDPEPIRAHDRKALAREAHVRCRRMFEPVAPAVFGTTPTNPLVRDCVLLLEQGATFLEKLGDDAYLRKDPAAPGTIGAHFRHAVDVCEAFLGGIDRGRIDFDRRARDPELERDRALAIDTLWDLAERMRQVDRYPSDTPVQVQVETPPGAGPRPPWSRSTVGRELRFLLSHQVHHYALVALLARLAGAHVPAEFGVSASTLTYWADRG